MARDNILLTYVVVDVLFVVTGALLIIFSINTQIEIAKPFTKDNVVKDLLLGMCPLNAAVGNAVLVFVTFLLSIPAIVMPTTRTWLKIHGYMTVVCAIFTLVLGLDIWFETLKTRSNLAVIWSAQPADTQSLIQQVLGCCGYMNSTSPPFVKDATCPNALVAAAQLGCVTPFSGEANNFLDLVFTGAFGIVGIDAVLVILTAIVLKDRKEKERYRFIDEKNGAGAF
ncbi:hypothetical protein GLAREA_01633 [Glarea lozoyensis ATCC 20868]|uniref:Tetraspanin n=1 Tax=Glarea lozoyensis (strain ATCC 20868 / MF5171) TaxID=1116229 RepID=S3D124_GLAL2|nr:uncharacterized protein GLAREA_01633 [Glarea lozoyensis ATCC 20868]EPE25721.1 hypothetical protein GLAREA_01633 [Glarea lozoyensis ATCC 20868]